MVDTGEVTIENIQAIRILRTFGEETLTKEEVEKKYCRMFPPKKSPDDINSVMKSYKNSNIQESEELDFQAILDFLCKEGFLKSSTAKNLSKGEILEYSITDFGRGKIKNKKDTRRK